MAESNLTRAAQDGICAYEYTVKRGDSFYLISHRLGIPLRDLLAANSDINPARLMVGDVLCIPTEESNHHVPPAQTQSTETPPPKQVETPKQVEIEPLVQTPAPENTQVQPLEQTPAVEQPPQITEQPLPQVQLPEEPTQPQVQLQEVNPQTSQNAAICPGALQVTVAQGQTAADIQLAYEINLHTLQVSNPDVDLENLRAGQVLCVPETNLACPVAETYRMLYGETLETVAVALNVSIASLLRANPCLAPSDFAQGMCIVVPK